MGRPRQKKAPREKFGSKKRSRAPSKNAHATSTEEFDDDIDKFHKGADKIPLDLDEDSELSEGDAEEPVFNLKAEGSSDDEDVDEDSDDHELDEEQLSGLAAKMAKQAKLIKQKTSLMDDEEDEGNEEQGVREKKAAWGKRKKAYYDADNADYELLSSDEEAPAEEEAEALRLQRQMAEKLRPEDFDLDMEDDEKSAEEDGSSLQEVVAKAEAEGKQKSKNFLSKRRLLDASKDASILVEEVKKDVSALSKEEQMNVVMSDAPELVGLLTELRESSSELHNKIEPLLVKVKECSNGNKGGLRFLEAKRILLLSYVQSILFYLLMKSEGRSVRDHPIIARLVEIRTLLQKLQPIEDKLQSQIEQLLTSSKEAIPLSEVKGHESPKPYVQLPSTPSREEENLQAPSVTDRQRPEDGPIEVPEEVPLITQRLEMDIQIPANTSQRGKPLAIVQSDEDDALRDIKSLHKIISNKVQKRKPEVISGDMDLPLREELGVRRAKLERQRVPYRDDSDISEEHADGFEDEFYQQAKRLKAAKKSARDKEAMIIMPEPAVEEDIGKRHITYQMEKNKGLTPHRKKLTKNPRKKYKLKHQKAVIRRKGQVREIKRPSAPYGGEATGIRTAISRSVRFHH